MGISDDSKCDKIARENGNGEEKCWEERLRRFPLAEPLPLKDWIKYKKMNNENPIIPTQNRIDTQFRHYRSSASIFSATIIVLAGASLAASEKIISWIGDGSLGIVLFCIFLFLNLSSILTAVLVQFFIFRGYHEESNIPYSQGRKEIADKLFGFADRLTKTTLTLFFLWGGIGIILFW